MKIRKTMAIVLSALLLLGLLAGCGAQQSETVVPTTTVPTVDIGGTSTDISLVVDGKFEASDEKTISGYPVRIPSIDISTIGADTGGCKVDTGDIQTITG